MSHQVSTTIRTTTHVLPFAPPYAYDELLAFLQTRAIPGVERVAGHAYERTFGTPDAPGWLRVECASDDALKVRIRAATAAARTDALVRLRRVFDLDLDPAVLRRAYARDPLMAPLLRARPGLRLPGAWDGFELAIRAILGQQVSVAAARTHATRMVERLGVVLGPGHGDEPHRGFPLPQALADFDQAPAGMPGARAAAIATLARAVRDGQLSFDPGQELDPFVASCVRLRGLGDWTAQYIAMRALHHRDAFPAGDLILRRAANPGGEPLSESALRRRAEAWRPYRAHAVIHLWRSTM